MMGRQALLKASAPVPWTFANTTTAAWHSAVAGVTSSGGLISQLDDRKGNGINPTATTTQRPTIVSNVLNGRPVIRFNGTTNRLRSAGANLLRNVSGATLIAVVRRTSNLAASATFIATDTSFGNNRAAMVYRVTAQEGIGGGGRRVANSSSQGVGSTNPYSPDFKIVILILNYAAATLTLRENGSQVWTGAFQDAGVTENSGGALCLGANADAASGFFNGDIAETAVLHVAAGTALCQQAEGYLGHEWALNGSLAADHPFLVYPPYIQ
jgi:hypothetical protein